MTQELKTGGFSEIYTMNGETALLSPPCRRTPMARHVPSRTETDSPSLEKVNRCQE